LEGTLGKLDGKVAIVTGGASGIGRSTVEAFVREGARVVVADLSDDGIGEVVAALGHDSVDGVAMDVRDEDAVGTLVEQTVSRFGRLDIALNNAGIGGFSPIQDYPLEEWDRVIGVCLTGVFLCMKHEAAQLIKQGDGGSIINTASLNATQPAEGFAAYCAAKGGVSMLTKVGALELGRHRIRVNAVGPGLIHTPLTAGITSMPGLEDAFVQESPMGRVGEPEDVANLVTFLAGDDSTLISGQTYYIDGGANMKKYPEMFSFLPGG
jgi:NAD(P)-dependent dehydrogenase (short-subunit alcohol dehydrogenase family)